LESITYDDECCSGTVRFIFIKHCLHVVCLQGKNIVALDMSVKFSRQIGHSELKESATRLSLLL